MSLLWTLRKLVDPIEHLQAEADARRLRKPEEDRDPSGLPPPPAPAPLPAPPEATWRCRVCGHEDRRDFCPRCLAGTMARLPGR